MGRGIFLLGLLALAAKLAVATSFSPVSWMVTAMCAWLAVGTARGWRRLDTWDQRLMLWGMFSILSFASFLLSDPTFRGWSSVYYFCGETMEFCTAGYRWNLRGWRKAAAVWNFTLSTALALQRLAVEGGLGGLLPGEEAVTRESFVSIAWRLVPFWLNRWESSFGAECSSIIFEIPHFALELLVVLPLVQLLCGRLRIVGQPHLRFHRPRPVPAQPAPAAPPTAGAEGAQPNAAGAAAAAAAAAAHGGPAPAPLPAGPAADDAAADSLVPNVLLCAWERDSAQRRLLPRLRANLRAMAMIALISSVAAFNALVVPLSLERQAAYAPRSHLILALEPELSAVAAAARRAAPAEASDYFLRMAAEQRSGNGSGAESGAGGEVVEEVPWLSRIFRREFNADAAASELVPPLPPSANDSALVAHLAAALARRQLGSVVEENAQFLVSRHLLAELVAEERGAGAKGKPWLDLSKLEVLLLAAPASALQKEGAGSGTAEDPADASPALRMVRSMQRDYLSKAQPSAPKPASDELPAGVDNTDTGTSATARSLDAAARRRRFISAAPLYANLRKHSDELRRMREADHRGMVPLVEAALAIMRLSCERWFALVAVYVGYLLFRDVPPAARAMVRHVAWTSRTFQRAILLSFPAVCWAYGAGIVFSTFASVIFWAGPLMRAVERVRTAATSVRPRHWHAATPAERERAGGVCAICWGGLGPAAMATTPSPAAASPAAAGAAGEGAAAGEPALHEHALEDVHDAQHVERPAGRRPRGTSAMGLPCGHAYHAHCLLQWLRSCYGQGRTPTCPMCQGRVELNVRYQLRLAPAQGEAGEADLDEEGEEGWGGGHRRERGIPGLDALVDELQEDFRHRFEQPLGGADGGWGDAGAAEPAEPAAAAPAPPHAPLEMAAGEALHAEGAAPEPEQVPNELDEPELACGDDGTSDDGAEVQEADADAGPLAGGLIEEVEMEPAAAHAAPQPARRQGLLRRLLRRRRRDRDAQQP